MLEGNVKYNLDYQNTNSGYENSDCDCCFWFNLIAIIAGVVFESFLIYGCIQWLISK